MLNEFVILYGSFAWLSANRGLTGENTQTHKSFKLHADTSDAREEAFSLSLSHAVSLSLSSTCRSERDSETVDVIILTSHNTFSFFFSPHALIAVLRRPEPTLPSCVLKRVILVLQEHPSVLTTRDSGNVLALF